MSSFTCNVCQKTFAHRTSVYSHKQRTHAETFSVHLLSEFKQAVIFRRSDDEGLFHCCCGKRSWKDPKTLSKHVKTCPAVFHAVLDGSLEIDEENPAMLRIFLDAIKEKVHSELGQSSAMSKELVLKASSASSFTNPEAIPCDFSGDQDCWDTELWNPQQTTFASLFPDYREVNVPLPLLSNGFCLHSVLEGTIIVCLRCKTVLDEEMLLRHIETEHPQMATEYSAFCKVFSETRFLCLDEIFNYVDDLKKNGLQFPVIPGLDVIKDCYYYENEIYKSKKDFADRVRRQQIGLMSALSKTKKVDIQVLNLGIMSILALVFSRKLARHFLDSCLRPFLNKHSRLLLHRKLW
ncbi:hypothetical protein SJAG_05354 [Schizosaccharomyces japonicus yFS275]|uniref:C2H2-type domain-containing protein n=1 Tax=Schizosaccharomyces japonicus (strain yFS275 / FY16936) TaxID=402676 RepID=B6K8G1_SCHJY|nr:hypothetical protein SJAG_05354 [Schizosaccharomyces japonicus yFS275]EEB05004.1 hypothetical protein SJAG_05354 [Schizosaccharomyces japonicus yFS275]